jgi:hypothetical protein
MKFPKTIFVKHCPTLCSDRKEFLTKHLEERLEETGIKDVRWIEDYNWDDPFVQWLNIKLKLPYGPKLTSNFVKTLIMFKQMVDDNIEDAILLDDDVTFHKDWKELFEEIPDEVAKNTYINLSTSPFFHLKPQKGQVYQLPNNGGCEAIWVTKGFAKGILENLNMEEAVDIVYHGYLLSQRKPILNVPICHQTSDLEKVSSLDHDTRVSKNWVAYVQNYSNLPKQKFENLLQEFEKFKEKKKKVEDKFEELYAKKVNINNVKYILNDDVDHRLNILEF